jgi:predicted AlkP superfamily pyrophosphatase or phosphodiesterase
MRYARPRVRNRAALISILLAVLLTGSCTTTRPGAPPPAAAPGDPDRQGSGGINLPRHREKPHVLLISLDGFRPDYIDRYEMPSLRRLARDGVRARALVPVFPTMTFPNHLSLVTGLHPDRHGIVGNSFYDPVLERAYSMSDAKATGDSAWYRGEPIWATAEMQGMVAACFFWPGSDAAIKGTRASYWKPYDGSVPNDVRIDTVLEWLGMPDDRRPHLITLYMSDVDSASHRTGLWSPEIEAAVLRVDQAVGRLLDGIARLPVRDSVYVVVASDHGMADVKEEIAIDTLIDMTGIRIGTSGPVTNLHVVSGGTTRALAVRDGLNRKLRNGRAWLRADVPARLRHSSDPRIGDVVAIMDEGYTLIPTTRPADRARRLTATHGWDSALPSMQATFLVAGPGVRAGAAIPPVNNVDVYPFLTELLGLRPAAGIDGRASVVRELVIDRRWSMQPRPGGLARGLPARGGHEHFPFRSVDGRDAVALDLER